MDDYQKLYQSITILADMELNQYQMLRTLGILDRKIESLTRPKKICKPYLDEDPDGSFFDTFMVTVCLCAFIAAIIGAIIGLNDGTGFFSKIFYFIGDAIVYAFWGAIAGAVLSFPVRLIQNSIVRSKHKKQYDAAMIQYEAEQREEAQRMKKEAYEKNSLIDQYNILCRRFNASKAKLAEFYNRMHIDSNYRNLICVSYMKEFLRLKIATGLTGTNGLYYLIRHELRMDQMQCTLNDISDKLDVLIDRQNALYNELVSINQKCDNMASAVISGAHKSAQLLKEIENNTAITAYQTQRIAAEERYQSFMATYWMLT